MCFTNMLPVAALEDKSSLTVSAGDKREAIYLLYYYITCRSGEEEKSSLSVRPENKKEAIHVLY